ncbi:phytanoyl-CoA dioxygenase family protein [Ningiella sp. W23]|uniref:phytanoyl-CoA dioxygenase family protein n=1 Tax=Ningiella sp. W23 TaxID=3023715 RepID=UPI003757BDCE
MLTSDQVAQFQSHGYVCFEELFSLKQMDLLKQAANRIVDNFDPASSQSIFSTKNADTNRDDYFLTSGDKVRCFFEEEAFNDDGALGQDKHLSINKIGHALHQHVMEFIAFSQRQEISSIAKNVGVIEPEIRQSMYIFKQPKIGGEIRWHQDATYFFTQPQSVITFWLAVEDANLTNGCLQVHKHGANFPLKEQFTRYPDDSTELVSLSDISWPADDAAKALEVSAGSLVVFNGVLPHFSEANRSNKSRHAFTLHVTSARSEYAPENWLQAAPLPIS